MMNKDRLFAGFVLVGIFAMMFGALICSASCQAKPQFGVVEEQQAGGDAELTQGVVNIDTGGPASSSLEQAGWINLNMTDGIGYVVAIATVLGLWKCYRKYVENRDVANTMTAAIRMAENPVVEDYVAREARRRGVADPVHRRVKRIKRRSAD